MLSLGHCHLGNIHSYKLIIFISNHIEEVLMHLKPKVSKGSEVSDMSLWLGALLTLPLTIMYIRWIFM